MNGSQSAFVRYQMVIFVILAYFLSWIAVFPLAGGLLPHGPMIAAFIILGLVVGRRGTAGLWRQMTRWRVGWKWYLIAPGIFIAIHVVALAVYWALGRELVVPDHFRSLPAFISLALPLLFFGGQWEEPGWMGYALRYFQERLPQAPLVATLATGLIRMVWHTPLLLFGKIPWYDYVFYSIAFQIILTWIYHRTGGSVLLVMIAHLFSNLAFAMAMPMLTSPDRDLYHQFITALLWVVVLGILVATRGRLEMREPDTAPAVLG